jgi:hypothetical protein
MGGRTHLHSLSNKRSFRTESENDWVCQSNGVIGHSTALRTMMKRTRDAIVAVVMDRTHPHTDIYVLTILSVRGHSLKIYSNTNTTCSVWITPSRKLASSSHADRYRTNWRSGNMPDSSSGCTRFESRSNGYFGVLRRSLLSLGKCWGSALLRPQTLLCKSFPLPTIISFRGKQSGHWYRRKLTHKMRHSLVKLSLCLINPALCSEDTWGSEGIAPPFLILAPDGYEWLASRPGRFTPEKLSSVPTR